MSTASAASAPAENALEAGDDIFSVTAYRERERVVALIGRFCVEVKRFRDFRPYGGFGTT